jgi:hypothetical protein
MLRKALTTAGLTACALVLFSVAALAGTSAPTPAPVAALAAPGACAPALSAVFAPDAAPAFTPLVQPAPQKAQSCTSCTIVRGCFSCSPAATDKAPCAITICCGVETGRVCGTCSNHCVPPPA